MAVDLLEDPLSAEQQDCARPAYSGSGVRDPLSGGPTTTVVIVSHPRSGTHITLDFIRRNFPQFRQPVQIWDSASALYVDLDGPSGHSNLERQRAKTGAVILQSHRAGLCGFRGEAAFQQLDPQTTVFLYPFRRFSSTMKSFAEFSGYSGPVAAFLSGPDRFFGVDLTVCECARRHAQAWLARSACFMDVDEMIAGPEGGAAALAQALDLAPAPLKRRLPRRKLLTGKPGEALQRLTGRESTAVLVSYGKVWSAPAEQAMVDEQFADIFVQLRVRSIIPAGGSRRLPEAV